MRSQKLARHQDLLSKAGFNPGLVDGYMGPKTQAAIRDCIGWQNWLNSKGFDSGYADGIPGDRTKAAIRRFQVNARIDADGVIGPQSRRARRLYGVRVVVRQVAERVNPVINAVFGATKWPDIALHISASSHGDAAAINSWHRARGWRKGGYHAVILTDGTVQTGEQYPTLLRRHDEVGAHILGRNYRTYSICFISVDGNINAAQLAAGKAFVYGLRKHGCGHNRIDGHRFYPGQATSCPGVMPVRAIAEGI